MKKGYRVPSWWLALLVCSAQLDAAWSHHSYAMFDRNKTIEVSGTVTSWQFVQPHCWLDLAVPDKDGKAQDWGFESGGNGALKRINFNGKPVNGTTFKVGEKVVVTAWPLRDGRAGGYLLSVKFGDGSRLELFPAGQAGKPAESGSQPPKN